MARANWVVGRIHGGRLEELVGLVGVANCFVRTVLIRAATIGDGRYDIVFDILSKTFHMVGLIARSLLRNKAAT